MKKLLIIFLFIILTSCTPSKKDFEDLSQEKQDEIMSLIKEEVLWPYVQEVMWIAFDFSLSESQRDIKLKEIESKYLWRLETSIWEKYPEVNFNTEELMKLDNSVSENDIPEEEITYENVKYWDFWEIKNKNQESNIKIKIWEIVWKGKEITEWYSSYKATREFLAIYIEWENIWKKPWFISMYNKISLITKDWTEFKNKDTMQIQSPKEWYNWCIACEMNPWDKAQEIILFDINKIDLKGAKLKIDDYPIEFEI